MGSLLGWSSVPLPASLRADCPGDEGYGVIGGLVAGIVGAMLGGFLFASTNTDWTTGIDIPTLYRGDCRRSHCRVPLERDCKEGQSTAV